MILSAEQILCLLHRDVDANPLLIVGLLNIFMRNASLSKPRLDSLNGLLRRLEEFADLLEGPVLAYSSFVSSSAIHPFAELYYHS